MGLKGKKSWFNVKIEGLQADLKKSAERIEELENTSAAVSAPVEVTKSVVPETNGTAAVSAPVEVTKSVVPETNGTAAVSESPYQDYADGFFDCLTKYKALSKTQRRIIRDNLALYGPKYHRNFNSSSRRFRAVN